jgi:hypothetical protein
MKWPVVCVEKSWVTFSYGVVELFLFPLDIIQGLAEPEPVNYFRNSNWVFWKCESCSCHATALRQSIWPRNGLRSHSSTSSFAFGSHLSSRKVRSVGHLQITRTRRSRIATSFWILIDKVADSKHQRLFRLLLDRRLLPCVLAGGRCGWKKGETNDILLFNAAMTSASDPLSMSILRVAHRKPTSRTEASPVLVIEALSRPKGVPTLMQGRHIMSSRQCDGLTLW